MILDVINHTILSVCFGFLCLDDLLKSKRINKFCNTNIHNYFPGWGSTFFTVDESTTETVFIKLFELPFIRNLTLGDSRLEIEFEKIPEDCLFLKNNKTKQLFLDYYSYTENIVQHLKYFKNLEYLKIRTACYHDISLQEDNLSHLIRLKRLDLICSVTDLPKFYQALKCLFNLEIITIPNNKHELKDWKTFKESCKFLPKLHSFCCANKEIKSENELNCVLSVFENVPNVKLIFIDIGKVELLDYLFSFVQKNVYWFKNVNTFNFWNYDPIWNYDPKYDVPKYGTGLVFEKVKKIYLLLPMIDLFVFDNDPNSDFIKNEETLLFFKSFERVHIHLSEWLYDILASTILQNLKQKIIFRNYVTTAVKYFPNVKQIQLSWEADRIITTNELKEIADEILTKYPNFQPRRITGLNCTSGPIHLYLDNYVSHQ